MHFIEIECKYIYLFVGQIIMSYVLIILYDNLGNLERAHDCHQDILLIVFNFLRSHIYNCVDLYTGVDKYKKFIYSVIK